MGHSHFGRDSGDSDRFRSCCAEEEKVLFNGVFRCDNGSIRCLPLLDLSEAQLHPSTPRSCYSETGVQVMLTSNHILNEIRRLHEESQNGLLVASKGEERLEVFFHEGVIEGVSSNLADYRLGNYLAKLSSIPERTLDAAEFEARRQNIFFGEAIVRGRFMNAAEVALA